MKDVAVAAGVSTATVSNAFNRPDRLSSERRAEILRIAAELGYTGPHPVASSLRTGSIGAIGFITSDWLSYAIEDPASSLLLQGIARESQTQDSVLTLLSFRSPKSGEEHEAENHARRIVNRTMVDGFIAFNLPQRHAATDAARARGIPLVTVDAPRFDDLSWIGIDERAAASAVARHVFGLGHRRVGIVIDRLVPDRYSGPVDSERLARARDRVSMERLAGYLEAAATLGLTVDDLPIVEAGGFSPLAARGAARTILSTHQNLTAVMATSDVMALGILHELGTSARAGDPHISVTGFDDIPEAGARGLTTVAQPLIEKGRWAAQLLRNAIDGLPTRSVTLDWTLQKRPSTQPALH